MRVAVANLKGGTAKTTTAVFLAHAMAAEGETLLVDADPQGSALGWAEAAEELPFSTLSLPVRNLDQQLETVAVARRHVVVDTPPGHPEITAAAIRAVEIVVVPVQPAVLDVARLGATLELAADAQTLDDALWVRVLLTRVRAGTRSRRDTREALLEQGVKVLETEIPQREAIGLAGATVPAGLGPYEPLLAELNRELRRSR